MSATAFTILGPVVLAVLLLAFIGCVIVQLRISRNSPSWKGWIAPAIWFVLALFVSAVDAASFTGFLGMLIVYNVPTMILVAIYLIGCKKNNQKKLLQRMSIQDL